MGNCHIWNGQVADLVAPIFQTQTFRGNPTDSLCSYLVLASYVVFPLFFHYFFQIMGPCRLAHGKTPNWKKTGRQDKILSHDWPSSLILSTLSTLSSHSNFLKSYCCMLLHWNKSPFIFSDRSLQRQSPFHLTVRLFSIFLRGIVAVAAGPFLDFDSPWFSFRQAAPSPRVSWHRRRDPKFADSLPAAGTQLESWRSEGGKRILGTSLIK